MLDDYWLRSGRASIARRLGSYRYTSSLDYFAWGTWVLGHFDTAFDTCVDTRLNPRAYCDPWSRGSLDFWSIKVLMPGARMLAEWWS
jgi:hypothetical protein